MNCAIKSHHIGMDKGLRQIRRTPQATNPQTEERPHIP
jgi:hypothetical protein